MAAGHPVCLVIFYCSGPVTHRTLFPNGGDYSALNYMYGRRNDLGTQRGVSSAARELSAKQTGFPLLGLNTVEVGRYRCIQVFSCKSSTRSLKFNVCSLTQFVVLCLPYYKLMVNKIRCCYHYYYKKLLRDRRDPIKCNLLEGNSGALNFASLICRSTHSCDTFY